MTVWPASFFFGGLPEYVAGFSHPLSIPPTSPREPEWSLFGTPPKPLPQPTSARGPLPQIPQGHRRVAQRASDRFSARGPCPQAPQRHPSVANGQTTGLSAVSYRCSRRSLARQPCPQVLQNHPCVAASRPVHDQSLTDHLPITNRCSDRSSAGLSNR